jgi:glutathione S-transferase
MLIYGDSISGNCLKVKWVCDALGLTYQWIETDILKGQSRTDAFLAMNSAGQVPAVVLEDGRSLAQSNAIILYLAEGSALIPADSYLKAKLFEWLFWEQYSHEPYIAVARFRVRYEGLDPSLLDERLIVRGNDALRRMEAALAETGNYLVGSKVSLADIALVAYTRMADEGGFDLQAYPAICDWIARVERDLGISANAHRQSGV